MCRRPQGCGIAGFTLVEIMIALLVLGVGLLGALMLLSRSTRATHDAQVRAQATLLAQALTERMRANPAAVRAGRFDDVAVAGGDGAANGVCAIDDGGCDAVALAAADIATWQRDVSSALPGGAGGVTCAVESGGRACAITLTWRERFAVNDDDATADRRGEHRVAVRP